MRSSNGFTMIELMVIVAIVGILIAIAAPSFTESLARRRLEGVANELSADLHYAKSQAASVNLPVSLMTTANGYTISSTVASVTSSYKAITLDSKFSLTPDLSVTFEPYRDLPDAAVAITISHSQTAAQVQVTVDAFGRIQMCSPGSGFGGYPAC